MGTIKDVKKITAAALGLRAALLTMRSIIGPQSATRCEREAERILGELGHKRLVSPSDLKRAQEQLRHSNETRSVQHQTQAILGEQTLQISEIYQQLVALGRPDSHSTYTRLRESLSKHCNGRGEQLFVRVKQGWYRCVRLNEVVRSGFDKLPRGLVLRIAYDVMGDDTLNAVDILERIIASKEVPTANSLRVMTVAALLAQNDEHGAHCFERCGRGRYRRIPGKRPPVETPVSVILDAMCIILRNGPLAGDTVRLRLADRGHTLTAKRAVQIMRTNSGSKGRRLFERKHRGVYQLAVPDALKRIVDVLTSGEAMTPVQIAERVGELGYTFPIHTIRMTLSKHSGFGLPLRRIARGLYTKNITPVPGVKT